MVYEKFKCAYKNIKKGLRRGLCGCQSLLKDTPVWLTVLIEVVCCATEFVRAPENIMKLFLQLEGQWQKKKTWLDCTIASSSTVLYFSSHVHTDPFIERIIPHRYIKNLYGTCFEHNVHYSCRASKRIRSFKNTALLYSYIKSCVV